MVSAVFLTSLFALGILAFWVGLYKFSVKDSILASENISNLLNFKRELPATESDNGIFKTRSNSKFKFVNHIELMIESANLKHTFHDFITFTLCFTALGSILFFITLHNLLASILLSLAWAILPYLGIIFIINNRNKKADEQFADVLGNLANCFKSGYGLNQAIQFIGQSYQDPWGTEFKKMTSEIRLGLTVEQSLDNLSRRIKISALELFITAIMIQRETGGNLSETLQNLSQTCRERYKLFRKVQTNSAQGKLSATIIIIVPFFIAGMMLLFMRENMQAFLTNPIGMILMTISFFWMLIGIRVLYKITQIEV